MSREDPQMKIRLPVKLKEAIEKSAKKSGRSMNAEICFRLEESFSGMAERRKKTLMATFDAIEEVHESAESDQEIDITSRIIDTIRKNMDLKD
jgi:hypothetical protein